MRDLTIVFDLLWPGWDITWFLAARWAAPVPSSSTGLAVLRMAASGAPFLEVRRILR
jgi:hypothetical protein